MGIEETTQKDLSLSEEDAERIVGGKKKAAHNRLKRTSTYVPGETGVVNPTSSGMAGPADASADDEC